jgi:hypothetical protein
MKRPSKRLTTRATAGKARLDETVIDVLRRGLK